MHTTDLGGRLSLSPLSRPRLQSIARIIDEDGNLSFDDETSLLSELLDR